MPLLKILNPNAGEIDSMNVSVAAAILILKPKAKRILKLHFDSKLNKQIRI
jgi:hypothetical protein